MKTSMRFITSMPLSTSRSMPLSRPQSMPPASPRTIIQRFRGINRIRGYKKGGVVKKTGLAYLHKGERVISSNKRNS